MIELYHNSMSTCAQKVRMVLAEKGLEWTSHHIDLRSAEQHSPEYLKLNPNGVMPTLIDDGNIVIESTVIGEYLDSRYPEPPLRPADPYERARMRLWTKQLDEGLHGHTGVLSTVIAWRFQDNHEAQIETMPDPAKRARKRESIRLGYDAPIFHGALKRYDKLLGDMETALAAGPWLAGNAYSLADIAYVPYMARLDQLGLMGMTALRPHVADWYRRLQARPAYEQGLGKWFDPKYITLMKEKGAEAWPKVKTVLAA